MKLSAFLLALIPLALASPVALEPRADNYAAIKAALTKAGKDTSALKATLAKIPDGGPISGSQQSALLKENQNIENDLKKATSESSSSSALSKAQSKVLYNTVVGLEPNTYAALNAVVAHKVAFTKAGVLPLVCQMLTTQKNEIASLGKALAAKSAQPYKGKAPAVEKAYASHFAAAESKLGC